MTREATRAGEGSSAPTLSDADVLAALWEEAPFPRLPRDAPGELKKLVVNIENPKRVYAIHCASRRHSFQSLVEKFIVQLRDGCGSSTCLTPTCFSCRKRAVGKAPIRRYNTTSARTLAIYMASQDNPETWLCPNLRAPRTPPAALRPLVFSPTSTRQPAANGAVLPQRRNNTTYVRSPPPQDAKSLNKPRSSNATGDEEPRIQKIPSHEETGIPRKREKGAETQAPGFTIHEKSVRKDYRSFAANMFNTVAFKMLEWLTPNSLDAMSRKVKEIQNDSGITPDKPMVASRSEAPAIDNQQHGQGSVQAGRSVHGAGHNSKPDAGEKGAVPSSKPLQNQGTAGSSTTGRARAASAPKPKRQVSVDPFPPAPTPEDILAGLGSPQMASGLPTDGVRKGIKPQLSRRMSQLNASTFVDPVRRDEMAPPSTVALAPEVNADKADADRVVPSPLVESPSTQTSSKPDARAKAGCRTKDSVPAVDYDRYLPQTLSVLNLEIIDLFCDILEDGGPSTASHMLEPQRIPRKKRRVPSQYPPLKRQREPNASRNRALQHEWNQFINQTFFSVLGDPKALIRSFSTENGIFDSQTLWYCLLRITRAAPSVALDSLWRAAAALFELPQSVQSLRSPTSKAFRKTGPSLSNSEAADLMAICLHALVAVAPLVDDPRQLLDMSRIRSHGLRLSGSGAIAKQPVELCLQYEDAFSNELALRLARRLFTAITTRNRFDDVVELSCDLGEGPTQCHILETVLSQMDSFNNDMPSILLFSPEERAAHEKRVPILLLDWARTVMMNDWDGQPEVNGDGPVGGALELIKTMYHKRQSLFLGAGDVHFRSEYFAERLDSIDMPVAWLSFSSTRQRVHLLDYPYIFNPQTLVTYFRSINFSRMSRSFEESSSLQNRMHAIVSPGSLITDPHHKSVLQSMLKTASSKYLILQVRRDNIVMDTFNQLWRREERELMRPLKVHLGEDEGEEGFDSGGVQQEFFRLVIAEILNPDRGAFTIDDRTRMTWFQPGSLEPEWVFELTGLIMSLAVYNGLTLPVTFPKAFYRKLLGEPVTELNHIADGWPDLVNGLTTLIDWDEKNGLVEDVFARTYEFSVSVLGQPISREMHHTAAAASGSRSSSASKAAAVSEWPKFAVIPSPLGGNREGTAAEEPAWAGNPADAPMVTGENRHAYVADYITYLTDVSVRRQFEALARGFRACLHPKSLSLLDSTLLQSVVEGNSEIDVAELRRYTRYVGWDASHRTVRDFWSVVRRYDENMRRKLLEFVTASDRVPVGGMKNIQFVLQRNGEADEGGHLPTAYTCYGTLLLPVYKDREVLKERLAMALENAQGFGFA